MNATDVTGKTNGITLSSDVQVVNGISGNAIYLPALSYAYLNIGSTLSIFSISFWRKWDSVTDTSYHRHIFYLSSDFYAYFDSTDNYLVLKMPGKTEIKTTILDDANNNHFCITYKQSAKIIVYINGVSIYNVTAENQAVDFQQDFYIGKTDTKAHATFDEVRFYSKVVTPTEVAGLYRMVAKGYSSKSMQSVVATTAPKYLGIGILAGTSIALFTGASVSSTGSITIGDTIVPNVGDFMVNYSTTNAPLGIYVWSGTLWTTTTDVSKLSSCAVDLINLNAGGITVDQYTIYTAAIIKSLFAQEITLLPGGRIHDHGYIEGESGFNIKDTGAVEFGNIKARGSFTNGKLFTIGGDYKDRTEEGLYIGDGVENYTHIEPINGDNNSVNWYLSSVLATYTAETFVSDYIRAARLESGYFAILLSANTFGIYKYKLGAITKVVSVTIPTSITIVETCDILSIGGNPIDGFYIGIQDNNVLRIYIVYMSGTISLQKTITFPVNVRNILPCAGTHQYSHTFIVESYSSTDQTDIYLYGYTWNTSTLTTTPLATIASLVTGGSHVQQNQALQYNLYIDGEESKYMQSVLLGNNIIRYKINDVSISAVYSSVGYEDFGGIGNAIGCSGRGSIFGNAIFIFSSINDKYAVKTWRGVNADTFYTDAFDGISVSSTESPHRLIPLKYGTMACIGSNFGGIKVISIAPKL